MSSQTKVGILFVLASLATIIFVSFLGRFSLRGDYNTLKVAYNFVGGLE